MVRRNRGPASAVEESLFDEEGATVIVTPLEGSAVVAVDGGSIEVDGAACGGASVTTTDTIVVEGGGGPDVTISLLGGPFVPGATNEGDGSSEIEFTFTPWQGDLTVIGSSGNDAIAGWFQLNPPAAPGAAWAHLLSLNEDEVTRDADVIIADGIPNLTVQLGPGDDRFVGTVDGATPYVESVFVQAGAGDDTVIPGLSSHDDSFFFGGDGVDTFSFAPFDPTCFALLIGKGGTVGCDDGGSFSAGVFERLVGHAGADWLGGGARLQEGLGRGDDDNLFAGPGAGVLDGGAGRDLAAFSELLAPRGVRIDLREGTARGRGHDVLISIEDVHGSPFGDVVHGDARANRISGAGGNDTLHGRGDIDTLDGGDGTDTCDPGPPGNGETVVNCEG